MEPIVPHNKLESGVFQGTPDIAKKEKNSESSAPRIMRTMKSDADEAIKRQNETSVSIAVAEQKKQEKMRAESTATKQQTQGGPLSPAPKPIGRVIVVIVLLIIITALGLAYVFVLPKLGAIQLPKISIPSFGKPAPATPTATTTEPVLSLAPSLIPTQSEKRFNITNQTRTQVLADITAEMKLETPSGSVKNLYFTEGSDASSIAIPASRLLSFAGISAPEILTRSLEKTFMAGFLGENNGNSTPFVILKVSSYETGLAGMLEWETTVPRSFDSIFGTKTVGTATSTARFRDIVVLGKDARSTNVVAGDTLSYVFANQNTIVIAGSKTALETLIPIAGKN